MKNERLRFVRERLGLTQEDLSELTGLSVRAISRLENGLHSPHPSTVRFLCHALQTTPEELGYEHLDCW